MGPDKIKQFVALIGGFLSAILLFLGTLGITLDWFNQQSIDAFLAVLAAGALLAVNLYGVYKNTYVLTEDAKKQEEELKRRGLK
jgi:protein-S-isoprenylcysteine O-methyltransferase Ste14